MKSTISTCAVYFKDATLSVTKEAEGFCRKKNEQ